jgi:hypothetical protein
VSDVPAGGPEVDEAELRQNAQHHVGGFDLGIMSVKPDDEDPAVLLAVRDPQRDEVKRVVVRPGQPREVFGRRLEVLSIVREPRALVRVRLSVPWSRGGR